MAATSSISVSHIFRDAISYALTQLGVPDLVPKEEQLRAIAAINEGKDVFVWLPTGYGKSLCYQVLPFLFDHKLGFVRGKSSAVVVFSPLISLMVDQVQSLRQRGVEAVVISQGGRFATSLDKETLASPLSLLTASLIFCSPEILSSTKWRDALESILDRVCAVVVDEAHCSELK